MSIRSAPTDHGDKSPVPARGVFDPFGYADIDQSIPARFGSVVRRYGHSLAVKFGSKSLSYDALDGVTNRIAQAIIDGHGDTEEPLLLLVRQSEALVASIVGALKAGKIYVPQDRATGMDGLRSVLKDCDPPLIVTDDHNWALAFELAGRTRSVLNVDRLPFRIPTEDPELTLSPKRAAYIYYTSGSTGAPKGVVDCHRNVLHNVMRYTNSLAIGPADRLSLVQGPNFSGAVSSMFAALLNGASVFPFDLSRARSRELVRWVNEERLTMFHSVPMIFEELVRDGTRCPALRVIRLEGDRAAPRHIQLFKRNFDANCWLVNGLGATETGLVRQFFVNPETPFDEESVPIGYPVADMDVVLLGDEGEHVDAGQTGNIVVRSRYLATGYWRRNDLTEKAFSPTPGLSGWRNYRTGDVGLMAADGCLYHHGRRDFQVKIKGQSVDIPQIESTLSSFDSIQDAVVTALEDDRGRQRLVAYIVGVDDRVLSVSVLRQELAKTLPPVAIPSHFVPLTALPMDGNRKIRRRGLPLPTNDRPTLNVPYIAPNTALERTIVECFEQVLDVSGVGIQDNFYDLGGDSLAATQLALCIEENLATSISSELFFDAVSVMQLATWIEGSSPAQTVVPLRKGDTKQPLFLFHDGTGHVLDYVYFTSKLNGPRAIFGLQHSEVENVGKGFPRLQDAASHYIEEIRREQPHGPYLLGGQCYGGLLAFEAAQQLRQSGEPVDLVILMDTAFPYGRIQRLILRLSLARHWRRTVSLTAKQRAVYIYERVRFVLRPALALLTPFENSHLVRRNWIPKAVDVYELLAMKYRAQSYAGALALICVGPLHNQRGWETVSEEGLEVVELAERDIGAHPTAPAHVNDLVDGLDRILAKVPR